MENHEDITQPVSPSHPEAVPRDPRKEARLARALKANLQRRKRSAVCAAKADA